jgi:hypothetical protein
MARLCRITYMAFFFGDIPKGPEHGYTDDDLVAGITYCEHLLEGGFTHDPIDKFDLQAYIRWAKEMLEPDPQPRRTNNIAATTQNGELET